MEVGDFFAPYPEQNDPDIQEKIFSKKEFNDILLDPMLEDLSLNNEIYYKHQIFFGRLLITYDILINMSVPGVGKTRAFFHGAEYFRRNVGVSPINQALVLTGKTQAVDFRQQLVELPGTGFMNSSIKYATTENGRQKAISTAISGFYNVLTYKKFLLKIIDDSFPIIPGQDDKNRESNRKLVEKLSGVLGMFDEVHFIRINEDVHGGKDSSGKYHERLRIYAQLWRIVHLVNRSKFCFVTATPVINTGTEIDYFMNLILPLDRQAPGKLMEAVIELSGIDPKLVKFQLTDEQYKRAMDKYPIGSLKYNWAKFNHVPDWIAKKESEEEEFKQYVKYFDRTLRGMIVYVGEQHDDIPLTYIPTVPRIQRVIETSKSTVPDTEDDLYKKDIKLRDRLIKKQKQGKYTSEDRIRPVTLSGIQLKTYLNFVGSNDDNNLDVNDDIDDDNEVQDEEGGFGGKFLSPIKDIMAFTYPDGTYGTEGFERWVRGVKDPPQRKIKNKEGDLIDQERPIESYEIRSDIRHSEISLDGKRTSKRTLDKWIRTDLEQLSAKYYYSVKRAYKLQGKRYVPMIKKGGSGAYIYGLCLEHARFEDPNGDEYPGFIRYRGTDKDNLFLPDEGHNRAVKGIVQGSSALRYAIIHAGINATEKARIFELWNHSKNWRGDYLKVLVVTKIGQTGINLFETIHGDLTDSAWNPATQHQAERRILRIGSFTQSRKYIHNLEVGINVLAVTIVGPKGKVKDTVDIKILLRTEERRKRNAVILRAMKACAIDAFVNIDRNTLSESMSGLPEADYGPAEPYIVLSFPENINLDLSTYNVYYSKSSITWLITKIQDYFKEHNTATINHLKEKISGNYTRTHIIMALRDIIDNRLKFVDMYGYDCFLREKENHFFVTRSSIISDQLSDITCYHYNTNLLGVLKIEFTDAISSTLSEPIDKLIESLDASVDFEKKLDELAMFLKILDFIKFIETIIAANREALAKILEYILENGIEVGSELPKPKTLFHAIMNKYFGILIFAEPSPDAHIRAIAAAGNNAKRIENLSRPSPENFDMVSPKTIVNLENMVLIHYFNSMIPLRVYSGASRAQLIGNEPIRIFHYNKGGEWRYPKDEEKRSYKLIIRFYMYGKKDKFEDFFPDWYGAHYRDNDTYHIVNNMIKSARVSDIKNVGKMVNSLLLIEICWLLYYCGIPLNVHKKQITDDIDVLRKDLITTLRRRKRADQEITVFGFYKIETKKSSQRLPDKMIKYIHRIVVNDDPGYEKLIISNLTKILAKHLFASGRMYVEDGNVEKSMNTLIGYK